MGISVIIPCYCCESTLSRALESVYRQTLRPDQVILINDASPDHGATLQAMQACRQHYAGLNIDIIDLAENVGPGEARNAGWEIATQEYLAFLDADDAWHPDKLRLQSEWMLAHPGAAMSGHRCVQVDRMPATPLEPQYASHRVSLLQLLFSNRFPTRSVMLQRALPLRFLKKKRYAEDYLLWLQISCAGHHMVFLEAPLAYSFKADYGAAGMTQSLWRMECGELDTYTQLARSGALSYLALVVFLPWSLLKFLVRIVR